MATFFDQFTNLLAVFSEKKDGNLRLFGSQRQPEFREGFIRKLGLSPQQIVSAGSAHSVQIHLATAADKGNTMLGFDGLFTGEPDVYLSVTAADCLPIYWYHPNRKIVGLLHAGWRGLSQGIIEHALTLVQRDLHTNTEEWHVAIGPAVEVEHYEVGNEVVNRFLDLSTPVVRKNGRTFLNLKAAAAEKLISGGIEQNNLVISDECTYCKEDTYFSYRRDKGGEIQTMMAVIGRRV